MIPKYDEMYGALLDVMARGGEYSQREMAEVLAGVYGLSEAEIAQKTKSGSPLFYGRVGWTKTYLLMSGLVARVRRGVFALTAEGRRVVQSGVRIDNDYLRRYPSFCEFISRSRDKAQGAGDVASVSAVSTDDATPRERLEQAYGEIFAELQEEVLAAVREMHPRDFEQLVVDLLRKMGYGGTDEASGWVTSYTNDEGIDGVIREDRLGFGAIYIQAKRWNDRHTVGRPEVQQFKGALDGQRATRGLFITTSRFAKTAHDYVQGLSPAMIVLVDGERLAELMIEFGVGVTVEHSYAISRIDTDYFTKD